MPYPYFYWDGSGIGRPFLENTEMPSQSGKSLDVAVGFQIQYALLIAGAANQNGPNRDPDSKSGLPCQALQNIRKY